MPDSFFEGVKQGSEMSQIFQGIPANTEREKLKNLQLINQLRAALQPLQIQTAETELSDLLAAIPNRANARELENVTLLEKLDPKFRQSVQTTDAAKRAADLATAQNVATSATAEAPFIAPRIASVENLNTQKRDIEGKLLPTDAEIEAQRTLRAGKTDLEGLETQFLTELYSSGKLTSAQKEAVLKKKLGIPLSAEEKALEAGLIAEAEARGKAKGEGGTKATKLTEGQANFQLYGTRLKKANEEYEKALKTPGIMDSYDPTSLARGVDLIPFVNPTDAQIFKGKGRELAENAKTNFMTAVLRKESGATISPSEFETADKLYFPQPGDTAATVKQKADLRKSVADEFNRLGGSAQSPVTAASFKLKNGATVEVIP